MGYVLQNIDNIDVASNEIFNRFTLNRQFKKLLENDLRLEELKFSIADGKIRPFVKGTLYKKNDLIWYITESVRSKHKELFLLRSAINDNDHEPAMKIVDNDITFEDSGWIDMFEFYTLLNNNYESHIDAEIINKLNTDHQYTSTYHKYGKIDETELSTKILLTDLSNIDHDRQFVQFPYETVFLEENHIIQNGFYRKWDCGLIEYSLVFKLGYTGEKYKIGQNEFDEVRCNTLVLTNPDEYLAESDQTIFEVSSDTSNPNLDYILINNTVETNHHKFVNTYSSKIEFPVPFVDSNYMIFTSDTRNDEYNIDEQSIDAGKNTLTFTNRELTSITPVYITYNLENPDNLYKNGLVVNNFTCSIIGRWK